MSLLIKALDKAENDKSANDKVEHSKTQKQTEKSNTNGLAGEDLALSLSLANSPLAQPDVANKRTSAAQQSSSSSAPSLVFPTSPAASASPKSAANVFSSKGVGVSRQNITPALIAGGLLIAVLAMGLYYDQFVNNSPDIVIPALPLAIAQTQPQPLPAPDINADLPAQATEVAAAVTPEAQEFKPNTEVTPPAELLKVQIEKIAKKPVVIEKPELNKPLLSANEEVIIAKNETMFDETLVAFKTNKKTRKATSLQFGNSIASTSASINVSKTKSEPAGINPVLMSAYEAYNAGNDTEAQKLYKQVLQRDMRNVDALLGLGAIALRQGRDADANGWFAKVLEVEPRNSMAQAALLDSKLQSNQQLGNEANNESRIKNMLAKHSDDANLHVTLGNLYAEQNQWPAAQQAYFDAYSLNGSAENALNLAVSLDQMGKPKLALPYYQRALEQASSTSSIDKAALEARIAAIQ